MAYRFDPQGSLLSDNEMAYQEMVDILNKGKRPLNDGEEMDEMQAKRAKTTGLSDVARTLSSKELIEFVSTSDLKKICIGLLEDEFAGPRLKEELQASADKILAHTKRATTKERHELIKKAKQDIEELKDYALEKQKGTAGCSDWPNILFPFFSRIAALIGLGSHAEGPERGASKIWSSLLYSTYPEKCQKMASWLFRTSTLG
ncbi:hypothetical protein GGR57DRAFT_520255 [Xylariaceae sp. FL1272]|nr:hypothetical protein GGR57DRAFT_520255 [Xylariaceae sp. FL1272]